MWRGPGQLALSRASLSSFTLGSIHIGHSR